VSWVSPASSNPVPVATRTASTRPVACGAGSAGGPMRRSEPMVSDAEKTTSGSSPRNTTLQPKWLATRALSAGPAMPGTTHAVDVTASSRGRSSSGKQRPMLV